MNKTPALTAKPIIYNRHFRQLFEKTVAVKGGKFFQTRAGSIAACILLQQLDYYVSTFKDGFFKFVAPCNHSAYKTGDSWIEELGFTEDKFRMAFRELGTA